MELSTLIGIIILGIVGFFLLKTLMHSIRFIFFVLLALMVVVFIFGISLSDVAGWMLRGLLWVL